MGAGGLMVVLRGVVRMMVEHEEGHFVPYYLGAGEREGGGEGAPRRFVGRVGGVGVDLPAAV